jgi:anti-anti-sigma regulatory factor
VLKVSIHHTRLQCRLVVEGKVTDPWITELRMVWSRALAKRDGREIVIDLRNVTLISEEGEAFLYQVMKAGARFRCSGVLTKHIIHELMRRKE